MGELAQNQDADQPVCRYLIKRLGNQVFLVDRSEESEYSFDHNQVTVSMETYDGKKAVYLTGIGFKTSGMIPGAIESPDENLVDLTSSQSAEDLFFLLTTMLSGDRFIDRYSDAVFAITFDNIHHPDNQWYGMKLVSMTVLEDGSVEFSNGVVSEFQEKLVLKAGLLTGIKMMVTNVGQFVNNVYFWPAGKGVDETGEEKEPVAWLPLSSRSANNNLVTQVDANQFPFEGVILQPGSVIEMNMLPQERSTLILFLEKVEPVSSDPVPTDQQPA